MTKSTSHLGVPEAGLCDVKAQEFTGTDVSVVLPCYTERRLPSIRAALTSVRKQTWEPARVVVAVDNNPTLAQLIEDEFDWVTVVLNYGTSGASQTRNRGVEAVDTPITAFLDDDEIADPEWLHELVAPLRDSDVIGTGGKYEPDWATPKPPWFPDEFAWVVGGSYAGMPTETARVRNVWSGNMAVRTDVFRQVGGFRTNFGKHGAFSQPEDTDLCIRMARDSGRHWLYVPSAVILHDVPAERSSWKFFVRRCFSEGSGKAAMSAHLKSDAAVDTEFSYGRTVLQAALSRLYQLSWSGLLQALTMLVGLASAGLGFMRGRLRRQGPADAPAVSTPPAKPALVRDFDVTEPVGAFVDSLPDLTSYAGTWILLRSGGSPVGVIETSTDLGQVRDGLTRAVAELDSPEMPKVTAEASGPDAGDVTVVICTRERPIDLVRALASLKAQTANDFRVLVVDNAPQTDATETAVRRCRLDFAGLEYAVEHTPGLSFARNRALAEVDTAIIAWIDDDEVADENWVAEIVRAFRNYPDAAAVSGSVVPAELETWAQWWFEQYGGHSKGRGFTSAVFRDGDIGGQSPLYPLPAFGAGANMAVRADAIRALGGFDVALGAGTSTHGGEDTLMFSQMLLSGSTVIYQPTAVTRHYHRREFDALEKQMVGYGVGLTAFYTALLRWDWRLLFPLIRLAPKALRDMFGGRESAATAGLPDQFPPHLVRLKRNGMLRGPLAYLQARRRAAGAGGGCG